MQCSEILERVAPNRCIALAEAREQSHHHRVAAPLPLRVSSCLDKLTIYDYI